MLRLFSIVAGLRQIAGDVVRGRAGRKAALRDHRLRVEKNIPKAEHEQLRDMAEAELLNLHEGNFARYQLRPCEARDLLTRLKQATLAKAFRGEPAPRD